MVGWYGIITYIWALTLRPPNGWEVNYVQIIPGRGRIPYRRAYGAETAFIEGNWELANIKRIGNFERWIKLEARILI